jgi:hypothetical protein
VTVPAVTVCDADVLDVNVANVPRPAIEAAAPTTAIDRMSFLVNLRPAGVPSAPVLISRSSSERPVQLSVELLRRYSAEERAAA